MTTRLIPAALAATLLMAPAAQAEPVVLINVFEVPAGSVDAAIGYWEAARDFLRAQPGYVSTQLHQSLAPDARFQLVNVARWDSAAAFQAAMRRMQQDLRVPPPEGLRFTPALYRVVRD
jgi:hypothetical protein